MVSRSGEASCGFDVSRVVQVSPLLFGRTASPQVVDLLGAARAVSLDMSATLPPPPPDDTHSNARSADKSLWSNLRTMLKPADALK